MDADHSISVHDITRPMAMASTAVQNRLRKSAAALG